MVFPDAGNIRHPSQLYQAALEGVLDVYYTMVVFCQTTPKWCYRVYFLLLYSLFRIIVEFFRQPDAHLGFIAYGWLTMGQLLSIAMFIAGVILLFFAYNEKVN